MALLFNRFWELNIKSNQNAKTDFDFTIKQDEFGNSLRMSFDINATIDVRYYSGTIKIYNLAPDKRKNLVFNILGNEFGTGPSVKLVAGYQAKSGLIMDGIIHRGYLTREPESGDWINVMQCGVSFKSDKIVTLQSVKITDPSIVDKDRGQLFVNVQRWIDKLIPLSEPGKTIDKDGRFVVKRSKNFSQNLASAVNKYLDKNVVNKAIGFSGTAAKILNEISDSFELVFYYDNEGFNVTSPILSTEDPEIELNQETGMIGSPVYTDTGTKTLSYLRSEFRLFQAIRVKSGVLDKTVKITTFNHNGDTHTDAWYSEIDANNLGSTVV